MAAKIYIRLGDHRILTSEFDRRLLGKLGIVVHGTTPLGRKIIGKLTPKIIDLIPNGEFSKILNEIKGDLNNSDVEDVT